MPLPVELDLQRLEGAVQVAPALATRWRGVAALSENGASQDGDPALEVGHLGFAGCNAH